MEVGQNRAGGGPGGAPVGPLSKLSKVERGPIEDGGPIEEGSPIEGGGPIEEGSPIEEGGPIDVVDGGGEVLYPDSPMGTEEFLGMAAEGFGLKEGTEGECDIEEICDGPAGGLEEVCDNPWSWSSGRMFIVL
jgi:hypothetical protein